MTLALKEERILRTTGVPVNSLTKSIWSIVKYLKKIKAKRCLLTAFYKKDISKIFGRGQNQKKQKNQNSRTQEPNTTAARQPTAPSPRSG